MLPSIEIVWLIVRYKLQQWRPQTVVQLKLYIKQEGQKIPLSKLQQLVSFLSFQMLIECCLKEKVTKHSV